MRLRLNDIELDLESHAVWEEAHRALPEAVRPARPLGVSVSGQTYSLAESVREGAEARILTYQDAEGQRIYERSLEFLFFAALRRVCPEAKARIEHSYGNGVYIYLSGAEPSPELAREISGRMRALVHEDVPFVYRPCSLQEAEDYFRSTGQEERARLMAYRQSDSFPMVEMDGYRDYFYGKIVPSTGYLNVFDLRFYLPGLLLQLPDPNRPEMPAPVKNWPKLMRVYAESARWNEILETQNVADLNGMIESGRFREFIRVNEALQDKNIQRIADQFLESGARLICIAGPSSSGKTTFAHRLMIALKALGQRPVKVSVDDYYLNRSEIPVGEDGQRDFERMDTLDVELFNQHLVALLQGKTVEAPEFDFTEGVRLARTRTLRVLPEECVIIEGIHALNDDLTPSVPREMKFKIYVSALTMLNLDDHNRIRTTDARLLRRIVRDYQFRGTSPEETLAMWPTVRRGEEKYIFSHQEEADAMFNSSLTYELPVMRARIYPMLRAVPETSAYYTQVRQIVKALNYVLPADMEDEIPINSILREFIGGCCFYRMED